MGILALQPVIVRLQTMLQKCSLPPHYDAIRCAGSDGGRAEVAWDGVMSFVPDHGTDPADGDAFFGLFRVRILPAHAFDVFTRDRSLPSTKPRRPSTPCMDRSRALVLIGL
jgi:hypothetical protein